MGKKVDLTKGHRKLDDDEVFKVMHKDLYDEYAKRKEKRELGKKRQDTALNKEVSEMNIIDARESIEVLRKELEYRKNLEEKNETLLTILGEAYNPLNKLFSCCSGADYDLQSLFL